MSCSFAALTVDSVFTVDPEKEVRSEPLWAYWKGGSPEKEVPYLQIEFFAFQPKIDFLGMAQTNFVSSIQKNSISAPSLK